MNNVSKLLNQFDNTQTKTFPWANLITVSTAFLIGTIIISVIGFANPEVMHNAAHDIRHSMIFPCH